MADKIKALVTATATATGGRNGHTESSDGLVKADLSVPKEMGGPGRPNTTTPEHLFAAGYAACFGSALQHVFRAHKLSLSAPEVHVTAGIGAKDGGGFQLAVDILAVFKGVEQDAADKLVQEAHQVCPYSNATRGNIEVNVSAKAE